MSDEPSDLTSALGRVRYEGTQMKHLTVIVLSSMLVCHVAGASPQIEFVGMARHDVVEIVVTAGKVHVGKQVPYRQETGDVVRKSGQTQYLFRNGKKIGVLIGKESDILRPFDTFSGEFLDTSWADNRNNYSITSSADARYGPNTHPSAIHRKHKPTSVARVDDWKFRAPIEYHIYLMLPHPLKPGADYEISFQGDRFPPQKFKYDPLRMPSQAVHVSHIGFHPDDPAKAAFVSCWTGSGGGLDYGDELTFHIIDDKSDRILHTGRTDSIKPSDEKDEDAYKRNFNLTAVYRIDFSGFNRPGRYRLCVQGIGCSHPFDIAEWVWKDAFRTSARGFYHQRSGLPLGPPYTDFKRPRPFHPDDGVKIYASSTRLMDTRNGLSQTDPSNFRNLVAGLTGKLIDNAWGGYMDAGDWDRRIQHLLSSLYLLDLIEHAGGYMSTVSLNIPESNNDLPDLVDEALFNLDCYRRMQTPEGGIRGGIESQEHPKLGETSWQESLTIMAYEPGSWSSFYYAGVAAKAAFVLKSLGHDDKAAAYEQSAIRAMGWAEDDYSKRGNRPPSYTINGVKIDRMDDHTDVRDMRNYAAAELFRLTGDPRWHEVFVETTMLNKPDAILYLWQSHEQRHGAWAYVNIKRSGVDPKLQGYCRDAILRDARDRINTQSKTAFRWTKNDWAPPTACLSVSDSINLVRAHIITGDEKYLRAIVLACQMGAGANPLNLCYTTHVGQRWPMNPLHLDSRHTGQLPPEGITVLGPVDPTSNDAFIKTIIRPHCYPEPQQWPIVEAYWDVFWYPMMCEFTIQRPMAQNAYIWGYLAGLDRN